MKTTLSQQVVGATPVMHLLYLCGAGTVFTYLVVPEGHVAAHAQLHTHVSKVTVPLATGLRNQLVVVEELEETVLEVLGAADAAAVKLATQQEVRRFEAELLKSRGRLTALMMAFQVEENTSLLLSPW